jgi:sugar-specific transcriptional regulator TrmB
MVLEDYLQKIGLSEKEAQLYLAGLQLGPATVQDLASESNLKRTTVYEVIKDLKEKKLINESQKGKKKIFIMEEPENVGLFLKQRENIFKQILPELESLQNKNAKKPAVRIYEGKLGLEKIYDDMIKKGGEILAMAAPKDLISSGILDFLREDWEPRRIQSKIPLRRLNINLSKDSKRDYKIFPKPDEYEQIKYLPVDDYPFTVGIYVYRQKVAFVSYQKEEMFGIVLRSPAVNFTLKAVFESFWHSK